MYMRKQGGMAVPEKSGEATTIRTEPKKDVDDLIFRWEPEERLISER